MSCQVVRKHLLGSERPRRPSAEASAHLAACAACREWQQRLAQMEQALSRLPVPPADAARAALVGRVLSGEALKHRRPSPKPAANGQPARRPSIAMVVGSWIMDPHASPRRRVAAGLVAGVAAALLLFITGWLVWDASRPESVVAVATEKAPAVPTLAAALERYKIKTDETARLSDRVAEMAKAADRLRDLAWEKVRAEDELIDLADLYARVIREGIVQPAEGLSAEERGVILKPITKSLVAAESQWESLRSQQTNPRPRVQKALENAVLAARDGRDRLEKMYKAS
jgi:hypothetical protein